MPAARIEGFVECVTECVAGNRRSIALALLRDLLFGQMGLQLNGLKDAQRRLLQLSRFSAKRGGRRCP